MRCLTPFQEAYREVASRHDCVFIDGQSYFHAIGRDGLLERRTVPGCDASVVAWADCPLPSRGECTPRAGSVRLGGRLDAVVIDPAKCLAHFGVGYDAWLHATHWLTTFNSRVGRVRYDYSERSRRIDAGLVATSRIKAGAAPEAIGLANVGIPAPIPLISGVGQRTGMTEQETQVLPCLQGGPGR